MKIFYITMMFPVPSEAFASNDVRVLHQAGADLSVHALRRAHRDSTRMIEERQLNDIPIAHQSSWSWLKGLVQGLRQPNVLFPLLGYILRTTWRRPVHLVKSLILLPRVIEIFDRIQAEKPDVVHLFWGHYPSLVTYLVQRHMPQTVTSIFLGAYDLEEQYGGTAPVARQADAVWTHAKANITRIQKLGVPSERIQVAYRGTKVDHLEGAAKTKVPKRILTAGRLNAEKGMSEVILAFSEVFKKHPDASLVILGDGPERRNLQELCRTLGLKEAVAFRGHVTHAQVFEEMRKAEIFMLLSKGKAERLPNVVKEAMVSECVCVVSATTGMEELIPDHTHGFIVPVGDTAKASRHVDYLLNNPEAKPAIVSTAKAHVQQNFDIDKIMSAYLKRWQKLADEKSGQKLERKDRFQDTQAPYRAA